VVSCTKAEYCSEVSGKSEFSVVAGSVGQHSATTHNNVVSLPIIERNIRQHNATTHNNVVSLPIIERNIRQHNATTHSNVLSLPVIARSIATKQSRKVTTE
jgi:hypothetical protein